MNKEQQLQAYIDEWADVVYDHFGMGESNEYSLRKAWLAGHAAAVEEYKKLNGWVKVTPEQKPDYYQPVPVVCNQGCKHMVWRATDGEKDIWTVFETDLVINEPAYYYPLPPSPEKEQQ